MKIKVSYIFRNKLYYMYISTYIYFILFIENTTISSKSQIHCVMWPRFIKSDVDFSWSWSLDRWPWPWKILKKWFCLMVLGHECIMAISMQLWSRVKSLTHTNHKFAFVFFLQDIAIHNFNTSLNIHKIIQYGLLQDNVYIKQWSWLSSDIISLSSHHV